MQWRAQSWRRWRCKREQDSGAAAAQEENREKSDTASRVLLNLFPSTGISLLLSLDPQLSFYMTFLKFWRRPDDFEINYPFNGQYWATLDWPCNWGLRCWSLRHFASMEGDENCDFVSQPASRSQDAKPTEERASSQFVLTARTWLAKIDASGGDGCSYWPNENPNLKVPPPLEWSKTFISQFLTFRLIEWLVSRAWKQFEQEPA